MNHQGGYVNAPEVFPEVGQPRRDAVESALGGCAGRDIPAHLNRLVADQLAAQDVDVVEVREKFGEEGRAVRRDGFLDPVENTAVQTAGVVGCLEQEWRNRSDEDCLFHAIGSVGTQITRHLAASHRKTYQCRIAKIELGHELVQVAREGVVIVTRHRLAGVAEASAIVRDDAATSLQQDRHLLLPGTAAERPAVDQDDRLTGTVVFVVEIDVAGVFRTDLNVWHKRSSLQDSIMLESPLRRRGGEYGRATAR